MFLATRTYANLLLFLVGDIVLNALQLIDLSVDGILECFALFVLRFVLLCIDLDLELLFLHSLIKEHIG